jgi:hypothetical protein
MARDWSQQFLTWSQAPSQTEADKADNTVRAVRKAIEASEALRGHTVEVFAQGSYQNRTNVRQDSDVDVGVVCADTFHYRLPDGVSAPDFAITPATYTAAQFRADLQSALISYFGAPAVRVGKKAFDVHENTNRINADVVPCFEFRLYRDDHSYLEGTAVLPQAGGYIMNWPQQNYDNGVTKNTNTNQSYKGVVRILKNLMNEMDENGIQSAKDACSFLLESLAYNVPREGFLTSTYYDDVRWVLAHLCNETRESGAHGTWVEVNEIKYLFHVTQPWERGATNRFLNAAWSYIGYQ